jgi:hypothetical protein
MDSADFEGSSAANATTIFGMPRGLDSAQRVARAVDVSGRQPAGDILRCCIGSCTPVIPHQPLATLRAFAERGPQ